MNYTLVKRSFLAFVTLGIALNFMMAPSGRAQSTGATFGDVLALGGTPSDLVLDEPRGRLYLVNDKANRIDVYGIPEKQIVRNINVGSQPLAAAMSTDGAYLYATNNGSSSLSVIDLAINAVVQTVSLPAKPEGVEVGGDGRVLISTVGTGTGNPPQNTLLIFDRTQQQSQQLIPVQTPPPPTTPSNLPAQTLLRPDTTFRGKLIRTPDGQFIVGVVSITASNTTYLFVYEVASGVILRSRTVTGQSTTLSIAPDGSRFMAGFTLYDTATLGVLGQQNNANAPFSFTQSFNVRQNIGGSAFSPDGTTLYSAFNVQPFAIPTPRPNSSTLLISNGLNLGINLGIKIPESIVAKMVITSDGANAWGMSESGLIYLPFSTLYDYPILQPETTQVFLAVDECSRGVATGTLRVNNLGKGKLTFSVPNTGSALIAEVTSGVAPSSIKFTMEPGRAGVTRQAGTNLSTGTATLMGNAVNVQLSSLEAINLPNTIRVYMNFRNPDQRGVIYPIPTAPNNSANGSATGSGNEGLQDLLVDETRGRVYITNSAYNRIEVFDTKRQRFIDPIAVGQLPHQVALATDGTTLYVGNTGGESISIVDLDLGKVVGKVDFPPLPRQGGGTNANPIYPRTMAMGLFGLQFVMSNGSQWKLVGNQATVRPTNSVTPALLAGGPNYSMLASPGNEYILTLAGNGEAYLYNARIDAYTAGRLLFSNPIQSYYGPLGAAPDGGFFLANGLVLNSSMTVIGGAERPGASSITFPTTPGQPPVVTVVSAGQRNVASVAPFGRSSYVRLTTPVRQNITSVTRDDVRSTLEVVDLATGSETIVGVAAENPPVSIFGTTRVNIPPRQLVVDSAGTAYAITLSGLSVMPIAPAGAEAKPQIAATGGIVNSNDGSVNLRPGSFFTVTGTNLASSAVADSIPAPTVMGGSCVTFNDIAVPLLQTASGQISAQVPEAVRPGTNVVQVRSLATAQASDPVLLTVQRPEVQP